MSHSCIQTVGELRAALAEFEDHAHLMVQPANEDDMLCVLSVGGLFYRGEPIPSTDPQYAAELVIG